MFGIRLVLQLIKSDTRSNHLACCTSLRGSWHDTTAAWAFLQRFSVCYPRQERLQLVRLGFTASLPVIMLL